MIFSRLLAALGLSAVLASPAFAAGGGPAGDWLVADGTAVVRISKCGGGYCGFVAKGQPGKDYRNPDPRKRSRSVIGIQVMFSMKPAGDNAWAGQTYNADDGQMYAGKISVQGNNLVVDGCAQGGAPCGSQTWSRAR